MKAGASSESRAKEIRAENYSENHLKKKSFMSYPQIVDNLLTTFFSLYR